MGVKYESGDIIYDEIGGNVVFQTKNIKKLQIGSFTVKDVQV
ncbi:hypothetical protein WKU33_10805 [Oceanobacillus sp. HCA-5259]